MADINRAYTLYDMMAKRFEASGMAPNQAKVYAATRDLIAECQTVNEAMKRIKNSEYYTAPAQAIMLDKMYAFRKAAIENKMPELAEVYDAKYKEIEADWMKAYETGYEKKAQGIEFKHMNRVSAFCEMFNAYLELLCCSFEESELKRCQKDLCKAYDDLCVTGGDFRSLTGNEAFRKLIPASDEGFAAFANEAAAFMSAIPNCRSEKEAFSREYNEMWAKISADKDKIKQIGQGELARAKRSAAIAVPPKNALGKYEFAETEVE